MDRSTARLRYAQHKASAAKRGIEWECTFEEWWEIWEAHWRMQAVFWWLKAGAKHCPQTLLKALTGDGQGLFIWRIVLVEIKVGQYLAKVDDEDAALVQKYCWYPFYNHPVGRVIVYAKTNILSGTRSGYSTMRMHRLILGAKPGEFVDHRNHDGLDNRRKNLRRCSLQENQFNKSAQANNRIGMKGVCLDGQRWRAQATLNCKKVHLGMFDTPQEARLAYIRFAKEHHGEFYCSG